MNNRTFQHFAIWCLIATSCCALSDAAEASSFDAAIQQALANRPELGIERSKIQAAKSLVDEAKGVLLPSLNLFGTDQRIKAYDDFSGVTADAQFGGTIIPIAVLKSTSKYQVSYGLELNYNLYAGGGDVARIKEMSAAEESVRAQHDVIRKQVILDVAELYWGLRKAQIALRIADRALDYAKEEMAVAKEQFEQGRISKIDFDAKILSVEKHTIEFRSSTRSLRDCRRRYGYALGIDATKEAEFQQFEPKGEAGDDNIVLFLSSLGLMKDPEVQQAQADYIGSQLRIKQARAEHMPVLDFFVRSTQVGRSDRDIGDAQANMGREATSIGVRLKWNLFNGFKTDSRVARAIAESEQLRLQAEKTQHDLDTSQQGFLASEEDVRDQLFLANRQLEFAQSRLEIALKRLETGQISTLEFHAAQLALDNAKSTVDSSEIDVLIQRIKNELHKRG